MDRIDDEPVRFFLRHRAQIEEWAGLVAEARRLAAQALNSVGEHLAADPPAGADVATVDDGNYDARRLYRPSWVGDDGRPVAAIGVGWSPMSVDFRAGSCWIGVWRGLRDEPDAVVDELRASLAKPAEVLGLKSKGWRQWPLYRSAPGPAGEFWDDLGPWLSEIERLVRWVWDGVADDIDVIVARARDAGVSG